MARIVSERSHNLTQLVGLILADVWFVGVTSWLLVSAARGQNLLPVALLAAIVEAPILVWLVLATIDAAKSMNPSSRPRIVFDSDQELVVFENCRVAKSFFSFGRVDRLECPFADILDIQVLRDRIGIPAVIKLVTVHGNVEIDRGFADFPELRDFFIALRRETPGGSITEAYWFPLLLAGGIVALIFGVLIAFRWI